MPPMKKPIYRVVRVAFRSLALFVASVALPAELRAESNWPRFRGPLGTGHCSESNVPVTWDQSDVQWRTELEGLGHSSPCIHGERIFLTTARKTDDGQVERIVLAVDRGEGKLLWQRVAATGEGESVHGLNSFASPTCASDGKRVVAFFGRGGIHCFDVDGKPLWSRDLGSFPGPWGVGASPVIVGETVVQNCDAQGASHLISLNLQTGEIVWRTERKERPRGGWNTPYVIDADTRRELVLSGEYGLRGYDPDTGKEHWFCAAFRGRGTPVAAFGGGMLYVVSGLPGDVHAVRPGGSGDVTESHMAWHTPRGGGRDLSSPIFADGYVTVVNMGGIGTCYDAATGKELWQERLGGSFSASPVAAGGLIYLQNDDGETLVIKPGSELKIVARNRIDTSDREIFRSSLAPSEGQIFLRSNQALYCVGERAQE